MRRYDERILSIKPERDIYRRCNCCGRQIEEESRGCLEDSEALHELSFGKNNQAMNICLCQQCLNDFAEMLWEYM